MARQKPIKKVLLAIPAGVGLRTLCKRTWDSVQAVQWPHVLDIYIMHEEQPETSHKQNLRDKFNRARRIVLEHEYDALWTVENDMIVPPHALMRLAKSKADITYGLYCSRRPNHPWLATADCTDVVNQFLSNTGEAARVWGKVVETQGLGNGCTLIRREVLEAIEFRSEPQSDEEFDAGAPDWYLAADAVKHGFRQAHDTGVVCGHIIQESPEKVVWPVSESPFYRIDDEERDEQERRQNLTEAAAGVYVALTDITVKSTNRLVRTGETFRLDSNSALQLMRIGAVTPANVEESE